MVRGTYCEREYGLVFYWLGNQILILEKTDRNRSRLPMETTVVNLRREAYDVYIGRGSPFGNPFIIGKHGTREEVIEKYRELHKSKLLSPDWNVYYTYWQQLESLRGMRLGCYCKPKACHGDVLVEHLTLFERRNTDADTTHYNTERRDGDS